MDKYNPVSTKVCSPKDTVMSTRETDIKEATDKEPTYKKTVEKLMTNHQPESYVPANTFVCTEKWHCNGK